MIDMAEPAPRLWSDFDGTAVALARKVDPRNWTKYPLRALPGFTDFLAGAIQGGVEFAGIVSRRPDIAPRRWVTARSISQLGISRHFSGLQRVVLTGSEQAKGGLLVAESRGSVVGMVEDKPHKLGAVLVGALKEASAGADTLHYPIVLGVVAHPRSQRYIDQLLTDLELAETGVRIREPGDGSYQIYPAHMRHTPRLDVVPLLPYSAEAGQQFATWLRQTS